MKRILYLDTQGDHENESVTLHRSVLIKTPEIPAQYQTAGVPGYVTLYVIGQIRNVPSSMDASELCLATLIFTPAVEVDSLKVVRLPSIASDFAFSGTALAVNDGLVYASGSMQTGKAAWNNEASLVVIPA